MMGSRIACALGLLAMCFSVACTTSFGAQQPNTQFVYPNSNVKILGPAQASITKQGLLGFNVLPTGDEVRAVYDQALSQQDGANVLVNFSEDTDFTTFLFWATSTYTIKGDAAKMEVGKQYLR